MTKTRILFNETSLRTNVHRPRNRNCKEASVQQVNLDEYLFCLRAIISMPLTLDTLPGKEVLSDTLVPSSIWKLLCILLIIVNFKNLPLIWHVSVLIFHSSITMPDSSNSGSIAQRIPFRAPLRAIKDAHVASSAISAFNHRVPWIAHGVRL